MFSSFTISLLILLLVIHFYQFLFALKDLILHRSFRKNLSEKFLKKNRRKYMCYSLIFNKVAGVYLEKLLKKRLRLELFQNSLFTEHLQESINVLFLTVRQLCVQYRGGLQRRWSMSVVLHH